jgi:hypothetical protein
LAAVDPATLNPVEISKEPLVLKPTSKKKVDLFDSDMENVRLFLTGTTLGRKRSDLSRNSHLLSHSQENY